MSNISSWSTTAASNNSASPNGFPEGMLPSGVNDSAREVMAAVRTWYEGAEWINLGHTPTFVSTGSFTIPTDVTATYHVGRRIKFADATTLYGTIATSSYGAPSTTITVTMDSGVLSVSLTAVALGIISKVNTSSPSSITMGVSAGNAQQVDQAVTTVASASTVTLASTLIQTITGTTPVTAFNGVAGVTHHCKSSGALPLTNSAGLSILQTGASVTLDAGASFDVYMVTATTCEIRNIQLASGLPLSSLVAKTSTTQTFTAPQRGSGETDNDGSFDLSAKNNFFFTPAAGFTLTFTNIPASPAIQTGVIVCDNSGGYAGAKAATTKTDDNFLTTISAAGKYLLHYTSDGTNVNVVTSRALS